MSLCAKCITSPVSRADAWCLDGKQGATKNAIFLHFTSFPFKRSPLTSEFLKIALKLIHFFTVFVHSSNSHRGVWVKALEKLWNQVKLHILPAAARRNGVSKDEKCPRSRKQFTWRLACLRVRDNEWEGRHMWVHRHHPAKKGSVLSYSLFTGASRASLSRGLLHLCVFSGTTLC